MVSAFAHWRAAAMLCGGLALSACADVNTDRMLERMAVSMCRSASNCDIYQPGGRYDPPAVYDQGRPPGETLIYDRPPEEEAVPY